MSSLVDQDVLGSVTLRIVVLCCAAGTKAFL